MKEEELKRRIETEPEAPPLLTQPMLLMPVGGEGSMCMCIL